jgi:hypothetical protein
MKTFYDTYATDAALEAEDGVVLDYGDAGRIRIHRAGGANRRFGRALDAKLRPYRRQVEAGTLDESVASRLMAEVYAESVVVGWDGVRGPDGEEMAFTKANVVRLLTDLPELFRDVQLQATTIGNFRRQSVREAAETLGNG